MQSHIAILRGINVSGHNKLPMAALKTVFGGLGFNNIVTYIQSGNVVFNTNHINDETAIANAIEAAIKNAFNFTVPVIIRSRQAMESLIAKNPFIGQAGIDVEKLHITFLASEPALVDLEKIGQYNYPPDKFSIVQKEVYLYCPGGYGNTKLSNTFFENKLRVTASTRNWKTVSNIMQLFNS